MATIKVKVRPSCIIGKAGTVYYQIAHRRIIRQITTDIHIYPDEWDSNCQRINMSVENADIFQKRIDRDVVLLKAIITHLNITGSIYSVEDIIQQFYTPNCCVLILSFIKEQIDYLQRCNRLGTAKNYERAMRSFSKFLGDDIPIISITEQLIDNYNAYLLQHGLVRNSISFYMRILRAIYNMAVRRHLVVQTNPFQNVYTGIDKTRKRAIDEEFIAQLYKLNLPTGSQLELSRDVFIFSYCTRGMAFVDIAYLKKTDIQNGIITYARHKTGQLLSIRIEPSIQKIIARYNHQTTMSPYVFPILQSTNIGEANKEYRTAINKYNYFLKKLSKFLPTECVLTSYTARHSWATIARKHNAPISVISAALGHTSEKTTQIYLTALENSVIDDVNQDIICNLNK